MHDTTVVMKDGRTFCNPIWIFRPKEGFLELVGVDEKLYFKDMISAWTDETRLNEERNELERAREGGWSDEPGTGR